MAMLRAGLSGCGARGAQVLRQVRMHAHCDVMALHDPDAGAMQKLGDAYGIDRRCADFAAMLQTGVDFVVLAGPCGDRLPQVESAAEQGAHCLLHAPMAPDAETAAAMVEACERNGVKLGVAVPGQQDPLLEEVRRMLADDWLGFAVLVQSVLAEDSVLRAPPPPEHWLRDPARAGAGALLRLASGQLHLVHWLVGRALVRVGAQATQGFSALDQDGAVATGMLRGGGQCTFACSHLARGEQLSILGTDGDVVLLPDRAALRGRKEWSGALFDYAEPGREQWLLRADLDAASAAAAPGLELHGRFARWIDDLDDFPCPGELAAADLRALDAMARAIASGRIETV